MKVKGTYVEGTLRLMGPDDRVHPVPTFKPSTMRLSYNSPNITNIVADRDQKKSLAAGFRNCIVASETDPVWAGAPAIHPGTRLCEVDFSAIEAVETGWFIRDPVFIRLAKLGVHSYLCARWLHDAPDLTASESSISTHLKTIKDRAGLLYDQMKRTLYAVLYGIVAYGLRSTYPDLYASEKDAQEIIDFIFAEFPGVPTWQRECREQAYSHGYLGGPDTHPFGYKHWFWNVFNFQKITEIEFARYQGRGAPVTRLSGMPYAIRFGEDAKRCVAFFPQSTAAGVLKEVLLRLFLRESPSYIGEVYYGKTPLRAPIHDSGLFEIPVRQWDRTYETICTEFLRPIVQQSCPAEWNLGPFLSIGIAAKAGSNWGEMEEIPVARSTPSLASEAPTLATLKTLAYGEDESDEVEALETIT